MEQGVLFDVPRVVVPKKQLNPAGLNHKNVSYSYVNRIGFVGYYYLNNVCESPQNIYKYYRQYFGSDDDFYKHLKDRGHRAYFKTAFSNFKNSFKELNDKREFDLLVVTPVLLSFVNGYIHAIIVHKQIEFGDLKQSELKNILKDVFAHIGYSVDIHMFANLVFASIGVYDNLLNRL